jgi:branched-chain amino acid transport system substrate-binding protein
MLELMIVDDQSDPEEAVLQMERLHEDGVIAVGGTISSGVGVATTILAEEAQIPLFLSKAGSSDILTTDSRYTFRTCLPAAPMIAAPWAQYATDQGYTKVGAIVADYAWGQSFKAAAEEAFGAIDSIELQVEVAPVPPDTDFVPYLRSLEEFEPELILATGHPPGTGAILVSAADLGFDANISGPFASLSAVLVGVGDTAIDRYVDYSCADYFSDSYADLAKRYIAASGNGFMEDDAVAGFGMVTMLAEAVGAVGDDPVAIAEYLHANTFDLEGMASPVSWTDWGELASSQLLLVEVGEGPAPDGLNEAGDWWPEKLLLSDPLEPFVPS